tara:strand:+ start:129 stop:464 length:336 start_codon:yes stop_codon:yes gene_type:complete
MSNLSQFNNANLKFNKNQKFTFNNTSAQSTAFDSETVAIYVTIRGSDMGGHIEIGSNPTATSSSFRVQGESTNTLQKAPAPLFVAVDSGQKLAAFQNTSNTMECYIMELKY